MENNQIKITSEELERVNSLRSSIVENVESIGRFNIKKHFLVKDLESVDAEIFSLLQKSEELDQSEKKLISEIIEKYGEGQLNFETGEYTKE
jgi:hypothetical protein